MTNSEKVSMRETLRLNSRAFGIWWRKWPRFFIADGLYQGLHALSPYVGIYLSAQLINELAGARNVEQLKKWVLAALISAAVLTLLEAVCRRWQEYERATAVADLNSIYARKMMDMDFSSTVEAETQDAFSQIKQNENWNWWGLMRVCGFYDVLIQSVLSIFSALALTLSLFTTRVSSHNAFSFLNHPLFIVLMLAVMLAATLLSPVCGNRASLYWTRQSNTAKLGNRFFSFFGFLATDRSRAMDIRMYEQERVCCSYMERDRTFSPGSELSQYAKGAMGAFRALGAAISVMFTGIVYLFTCLKAWAGAFGVGSVTQYVGAFTALSGNIARLISMIGDMRANAVFLRTTFYFLDIPHVMYKGSLTVEKRMDRNYEIEFRDVSFQYPGSSVYALRHVSLKFRVGERLAIVGQNGSGKTTFIKLLCRLYDPTEGEILLNGIDIRKYDYEEYMSVFSVVFQDFQLLAFALGENVAARKDYDRLRAETCLRQAGFGDRLDKMEQGLDASLYREFDEKGVEISGGEAQKIALARALYKDAPFIVLDEPTAALDPIAESEVYTKFDELVGDKTAIYISHRLSSCRFCENIAVFDDGAIIQLGTHEQLVAQPGKYAELWNAQAQYYQTKE